MTRYANKASVIYATASEHCPGFPCEVSHRQAGLVRPHHASPTCLPHVQGNLQGSVAAHNSH